MNQLALEFNPLTLARRGDPETSKAAAAGARELRNDHLAKIGRALDAGDKTKDEIASATGLDHIRVARRMKEGEDARMWRRSGQTRPSRTGRQETVWTKKPRGDE